MNAVLAAHGKVLRHAAAGRTTPVDLRSRIAVIDHWSEANRWFACLTKGLGQR